MTFVLEVVKGNVMILQGDASYRVVEFQLDFVVDTKRKDRS